jgi:hypothetical protein
MARRVQPGYNTGSCSQELFELVNDGFARQVYSRFLAKKYGVDSCVQDDFQRQWIKKQLLDLNLLLDPDLCCEIECKTPCGVIASLRVYHATSCLKPSNPVGTITVPEIVCNAPTDVDAIIVYQAF